MTAPRFTRAELESFHGAKVDDLIGPGLRLLFVGINPGLWTAAVNAHFARPGNRFWPALQLAGITPQRIDASRGLLPADREELIGAGDRDQQPGAVRHRPGGRADRRAATRRGRVADRRWSGAPGRRWSPSSG